MVYFTLMPALPALELADGSNGTMIWFSLAITLPCEPPPRTAYTAAAQTLAAVAPRSLAVQSLIDMPPTNCVMLKETAKTCRVGAAVGRRDGVPGRVVGTGVAVGAGVGMREGAGEGFTEGTGDGIAVGFTEGAELGWAEGTGEGFIVAPTGVGGEVPCTVGKTEGRVVGGLVGTCVPTEDGTGLGAGEGTGLGA